MEINLNLKNVKHLTYELYDGSKVEMNDKSIIDDYNTKCKNKVVNKNKDDLNNDIANFAKDIKENFQSIIDQTNEFDKTTVFKMNNKDEN